MSRTAFVTGAAGFLGRHLVEDLIARDWQVTAFCLPTDPIHLLPSGIGIALGDLTDPATVSDALPPGIDTVFHLAGNTTTWARNRKAQFRTNVDGTAHVIDAMAARGGRRLVYTSSISAYGYQPGVRIVEDTPSNAATHGDNYGKSKLAAEKLIKSACEHRALDAVILNPVNILGAYDTSNWSRQLIMPISKSTLRVVPPGSASWISVHDAVRAHIAAADAGGTGTNLILGGDEASFREVVNEIERILHKPVSTKTTSRAVLRLLCVASTTRGVLTGTEPELSLAKYRRAVGNLLVDDTAARGALGLGRTPVRDQLCGAISWLQQVKLLPAGQAERTDAQRD